MYKPALASCLILPLTIPTYAATQTDTSRLEAKVRTLEVEISRLEKDVERRVKVVEFKLDALLKERIASPARSADTASSTDCARPIVQEKNGFRFEMGGCFKHEDITACDLKVTSLGTEKKITIKYEGRAIDTDGNEYTGGYVRLGSESSWNVTQTLPADIPLKGRFSYKGVPAEGQQFAFMELKTSAADLTFKSICLRE